MDMFTFLSQLCGSNLQLILADMEEMRPLYLIRLIILDQKVAISTCGTTTDWKMEAAAELFEELGIGNSIRLPKVKKSLVRRPRSGLYLLVLIV